MVQLTCESGGESTTDDYPKTTVTYKTTEAGLNIALDIFGLVAATRNNEKRPAILWIHGGGLIFGTKEWIPKEQLDRYLARDYIVASINHRLAPETKVPDIVQDVCHAWDWITSDETCSTYGIDPDRIAVVGHSAGGYLALLVGALTTTNSNARRMVLSRHVPKAIVSVYGYGDITGPWVAEPNKAFQPDLPPVSRNEALAVVLGVDTPKEVATDKVSFDPEGRPKFFFYTKQKGSWIVDCCGKELRDDNRDWFATYEPIRYMTTNNGGAAAAYPPTFLAHGDKDNDVPVQQSVAVHGALETAGVPVELLRNADWPHLFDHFPEDPNVQDCLDRMVAFIQKHLSA